jgi:hypothetical protein
MPLGAMPPGPDSELVIAGHRVERVLRRNATEDVVYEALHVADERRVELRVVGMGEDSERSRFLEDAERLASLQHPHLPEVHEWGEAEEGLYVATPFLEGVALSELVTTGGLPPMRVVRLLADVADAIDAAHGAGLVHGNISPSSVVVVERHVEQPYLVGLPRGPAAPAWATPDGDITALAGTLFECLTGGPPTPRLGELLTRVMEATGQERPATAGALIEEASRAMMAIPMPPARTREVRKAPPAVGADADATTESTDVAGWPSGLSTAAAAQPAARTVPAASVLRTRRARLGPSVSPPVALFLVLAAAAGGYFASRPSDEPDSNTASAGAVQVELPAGWSPGAEGPRVRGLEFLRPAAAPAAGRGGELLVGRLPGLRGSVYPADVARQVAPRPPQPQPVRLAAYEALRFEGLRPRRGQSLTLFVVPTDTGTLAAACLAGPAQRECERAVGSLRLEGALPSGLAAGRAFGARLERELRRLNDRRAALGRRLRRAGRPGGQSEIAGRLARAHEVARQAVERAPTPPAVVAASREVRSRLAGVQGSYSRLARAARRGNRTAFEAARRTVAQREAALARALREL